MLRVNTGRRHRALRGSGSVVKYRALAYWSDLESSGHEQMFERSAGHSQLTIIEVDRRCSWSKLVLRSYTFPIASAVVNLVVDSTISLE